MQICTYSKRMEFRKKKISTWYIFLQTAKEFLLHDVHLLTP